MAKVRGAIVVPGPPAAAQELWLDTSRWATFVPEFRSVARVEGDWPQADGRVIWDSGPHGRGRVFERIAGYTRGEGQVVEVEDERIRGTETVTFAEAEGGVQVEVELDYTLKHSNIAMKITDLFFIRRTLRESLRHKLGRFAVEAAG